MNDRIHNYARMSVTKGPLRPLNSKPEAKASVDFKDLRVHYEGNFLWEDAFACMRSLFPGFNPVMCEIVAVIGGHTIRITYKYKDVVFLPKKREKAYRLYEGQKEVSISEFKELPIYIVPKPSAGVKIHHHHFK